MSEGRGYVESRFAADKLARLSNPLQSLKGLKLVFFLYDCSRCINQSTSLSDHCQPSFFGRLNAVYGSPGSILLE
jgi:hypothetical protein